MQGGAVGSIRDLLGTEQALSRGLIKNLGVKRSSEVPERQPRHRGEHPHTTGLRRGKKRRATKEWLQNTACSAGKMNFQGQEQIVAEEHTAKPS